MLVCVGGGEQKCSPLLFLGGVMEEEIYLVVFRDGKYREEGVNCARYKKEDAEAEAERLNEEDEYGYYYGVQPLVIK